MGFLEREERYHGRVRMKNYDNVEILRSSRLEEM